MIIMANWETKNKIKIKGKQTTDILLQIKEKKMKEKTLLFNIDCYSYEFSIKM